eukprot:3463608-Prymnesium_polylepis.6
MQRPQGSSNRNGAKYRLAGSIARCMHKNATLTRSATRTRACSNSSPISSTHPSNHQAGETSSARYESAVGEGVEATMNARDFSLGEGLTRQRQLAAHLHRLPQVCLWFIVGGQKVGRPAQRCRNVSENGLAARKQQHCVHHGGAHRPYRKHQKGFFSRRLVLIRVA